MYYHMTTVGFHKVIGRMIFQGPMTLSEITSRSSLKKPTIHHHLQNLMKQGIVVYDRIKGKYSIIIDEDLKETILKCLITPRTFEELQKDLIKASKNETRLNTPLHLLVKDKEFENKLRDILEFLFQETLVTEERDYVLSGTKFQKEWKWTLTWNGSTKMGLCHICKKEIDSKLSSAVVQTIEMGVHRENEVRIFDTMKIHPKCAILSGEQYVDSQYGFFSRSYDLCDYCGLPFSEKRLRVKLKSIGYKTGFELIYNLLSLEELDALNKEKKLKLILEVKQNIHKNPPIGLFAGEVLLKEKFRIMKETGVPNPKIIQKLKFDTLENVQPHETFTLEMKSFSFLDIPKFSDLERLGKIIEKHTKRKFDNKRLKELFEEWSKYHAKQEEKIEDMVSSILTTPMERIYPKIWNNEPGPWNVDDDRFRDPEKALEYTSSFGFSFVIKDEKGHQFHKICHQYYQNLQPKTQSKPEQGKRGLK